MADRFHLFCNLTQALQRVLERLALVLGQVELPSDSTRLLGEAMEPDRRDGRRIQKLYRQHRSSSNRSANIAAETESTI